MQTAFLVKKVYNHEGERAVYGRKASNFRAEDGNSIGAIAQTLIIARTTFWNVLKKKEATRILRKRRRTGRQRT